MESTMADQIDPTNIFLHSQLPDEILQKLSLIAGADVTKDAEPITQNDSDSDGEALK